MQQLAASLEENYSAEEINEVIQEIDDVADLQPGINGQNTYTHQHIHVWRQTPLHANPQNTFKRLSLEQVLIERHYATK